jgi:hypothetical protein
METGFKELSPKQQFGYDWWTYPEAKRFRRVVYNGAIRTLKTDGGIRSFLMWALEKTRVITGQKGECNFFILGTTRELIKENAVDVMLRDAEQNGYKRCNNFTELGRGKERFYVNATIGKVYFKTHNALLTFIYLGADNVGAVRRIQGRTFRGAFIDEGALIPLKIIETVEQRMISFRDYILFMTTNPEGGEEHEFYKNYIKGAFAKGTLVISYELLDNPNYTQEDIQHYKQIYTRDMFLRKILGKWVRAIGAVYPKFDEDKHVVKGLFDAAPYQRNKYEYIRVGVDYGETHATVFTPLAMLRQYKGMHVFPPWYHKDSERKNLDINDKVDEFFKFVNLLYKIMRLPIFVQIENATNGKSFYKIIRTRIKQYPQKYASWLVVKPVTKTQQNPSEKSAIEERISIGNMMLGSEFVKIDSEAKELIQAIKSAIRDDKGNRLDNGTTDIDSLDSWEYAFIPEMKKIRKEIEHVRGAFDESI